MSERELREQLKVTKRMLEMQHGRALKHGEPREAEAYYDAINSTREVRGLLHTIIE